MNQSSANDAETTNTNNNDNSDNSASNINGSSSTSVPSMPSITTTATNPTRKRKTLGNAILVNPAQQKNPLLRSIHNVPYEFDDTIKADYVVGATTGVLYLRYYFYFVLFLFFFVFRSTVYLFFHSLFFFINVIAQSSLPSPISNIYI